MDRWSWTKLILFVLAAALLAGCGPVGSGLVVAREIPIGSFSAIRLNGIGDVHLIQSDREFVRITTDDNFTDNVSVLRQGNELVVKTKGIVNPTSLLIEIYYQDISRLRTEGLTAVALSDHQGDQLYVSMEAGLITASGDVTSLEVDAKGIAEFDGSHLSTERAQVRAADVSQVVVRSGGSLAVTTFDSAAVEYLGEPVVRADDSAGGSIIRR